MKLDIIARNDFMGFYEEHLDVDSSLVSYKDIHHKNGAVTHQVRIKRGHRDIVMATSIYKEITVQEVSTGRMWTFTRED